MYRVAADRNDREESRDHRVWRQCCHVRGTATLRWMKDGIVLNLSRTDREVVWRAPPQGHSRKRDRAEVARIEVIEPLAVAKDKRTFRNVPLPSVRVP